MIKENLEKDILQYGLLIGISYQLYQTLVNLVPRLDTTLALINMLLTLMIVFLYLLVQRKGAHFVLILAFHVMALTGFTFFWKNYGGMSGTVPSFFCIYTSFIIVCSHGYARWVLVIILSSVLSFYLLFPGWLGMASLYEPQKTDAIQQSIDYVVVGALIVAFTAYMKKKFIFYRERVGKRYKQLDQIARTLHNQNQELATRQEETRAINENLESMVDERAQEVENKNKALAEYAFINAHMLRGPLCRIIGLINLMEKEPDHYPAEQLRQLKSIAQEIDQHVREINSVIS